MAAASEQFICIADDSKRVEELGFPLPVEVLPMSRSLVAEIWSNLVGDQYGERLLKLTMATGYWTFTTCLLRILVN